MAGTAGRSETSSFSESIQRDPGGSLGAGILNSIFGVPQRLVQGQFRAGPKTPFVPLTDKELRARLKAQGVKRPGKANRRSVRDGGVSLFDQLQARLRASHEAGQGEFFGDQAGGGGGFGGFGQSILGALQGGPGVSFNALSDLITSGGSPVDVSAVADANFTDLKEQFSGLGGLFGTDFQAAQGRNVLELDVLAQESARQRQLGALGLFQTFDPLQDIAGTQGGRELALFKSLFQPQGTSPFGVGADAQSTSFTRQKQGEGDIITGAGANLASTAP